MIDLEQFTKEDITGIYNLSRRRQKMHRDADGRPAVYGYEICGGLFIYAGEGRRKPITIGGGYDQVEEYEYRIERYVKPERGSSGWRDFPYAWKIVFYAETAHDGLIYWIIDAEGDTKLLARDWIVLKLHNHLWQNFSGPPG